MTGQARALTEPMAKEMATAATALSFDEAFTLHHRAVFRTARSVVRDPALAEDVTQEVFLRLYRNLDATPGEELLRAWLLRVTMNVARNTLRGQSRAATREDEYAKRAEEPMRSALLLQQQGLSYREIACALQLNETNVGSLIARGRKEFVRVYGKIG